MQERFFNPVGILHYIPSIPFAFGRARLAGARCGPSRDPPPGEPGAELAQAGAAQLVSARSAVGGVVCAVVL